MSWHYLQGQEVASWEGKSLDGAPSALLKLMPTPAPCCSPGSETGCCHGFLSGMTCEPSMGSRGEVPCRSCLADSHAKTSAPPERVTGLTGSEADYGWKWQESSMKYDPASRSWKTRQCSLLGGLEPYSETWPRWGSMRNGECWERQTWERRTSGTECGLLPTPLASNTKAHHMRGSDNGKQREPRSYLTWPTPTKSDWTGGPGCSGRAGGLNLRTAVAKWPTPTVNDSKNSTLPPSQIKHDNIPGALLRSGETAGGQLNPLWVEWLMGWPAGWTDLNVLEMDRFQDAQPRLGNG